MRESAEDLFPADPVLGEVDLRWPGVRNAGRCAGGPYKWYGIAWVSTFTRSLYLPIWGFTAAVVCNDDAR